MIDLILIKNALNFPSDTQWESLGHHQRGWNGGGDPFPKIQQSTLSPAV